MKKRDTEVVAAVRASLAQQIGEQRYELWFGSKTQLVIQAEHIRVLVPNKFFLDWLRSNFRDTLEQCAQQVLGKPPAVEFEIEPALENSSLEHGKLFSAATPDGQPAEYPQRVPQLLERASSGGSHLQIARSEGGNKPDELTQSRQRHARRLSNFAGFVVGDCNRLARKSAEMVSQQPGQASPLLIYGPTAVGKTHLLEAISSAYQAHGRRRALYLTAEQFTSHYLGALHGGGMPTFRGKYRGVELLIVDDLQFLRGKQSTIGELLHTMDSLAKTGRQLVFAADRAPADLAELGPEMLTRLQGGLSCGISAPNEHVRRGILRNLAGSLRITVPPEVINYVAASFTAHARELSGAMNRLKAASLAYEKPISLELAESVLADLISRPLRAVRLADIEQAVCQVLGLEGKKLQSNRRTRSSAHPRMLAMWLARKHTRHALSEIGQYFGNRSHATVVSAQKKVQTWMADGQRLECSDRLLTADEAIRKVEEQLQVG